MDILGADAAHLAVYARAPLKSGSSRVLIRRMPDDAEATAQQLFAVLRGFDDAGVRLIWVEAPPEATEWEGVRDRLQRAAAQLCQAEAGPGAQVLWTADGDLVCRPAVLTAQMDGGAR